MKSMKLIVLFLVLINLHLFAQDENRIEKLELQVSVLNAKILMLESKIESLEKALNQTQVQPEIKSNYNSLSIEKSPTKSNASNYNGRCQATTKKGTQCKRNAASGSKYCWQHGG